MERFKVVERETKTKAYSKEGTCLCPVMGFNHLAVCMSTICFYVSISVYNLSLCDYICLQSAVMCLYLSTICRYVSLAVYNLSLCVFISLYNLSLCVYICLLVVIVFSYYIIRLLLQGYWPCLKFAVKCDSCS